MERFPTTVIGRGWKKQAERYKKAWTPAVDYQNSFAGGWSYTRQSLFTDAFMKQTLEQLREYVININKYKNKIIGFDPIYLTKMYNRVYTMIGEPKKHKRALEILLKENFLDLSRFLSWEYNATLYNTGYVSIHHTPKPKPKPKKKKKKKTVDPKYTRYSKGGEWKRWFILKDRKKGDASVPQAYVKDIDWDAMVKRITISNKVLQKNYYKLPPVKNIHPYSLITTTDKTIYYPEFPVTESMIVEGVYKTLLDFDSIEQWIDEYRKEVFADTARQLTIIECNN